MRGCDQEQKQRQYLHRSSFPLALQQTLGDNGNTGEGGAAGHSNTARAYNNRVKTTGHIVVGGIMSRAATDERKLRAE